MSDIDSKTKVWKMTGTIVGVLFAVVSATFGALNYMDSAYASPDSVTAQIAPVNAEIKVIKVAQNEFTVEIRALRKDRIRQQIRNIKKEMYGIRKLIDAGHAPDFEVERFQDLEFEKQDLVKSLDDIN